MHESAIAGPVATANAGHRLRFSRRTPTSNRADPSESAARGLVYALGLVWALLWTLVALIEAARFFHMSSIPAWKPLTHVACSVVVAAGWLIAWLSAGQYERIDVDEPSRWLGRSIRWLPALIVGGITLIGALRYGAVIALGALNWRLPWPILVPYESIKIALFYGLWLGLAFGARHVSESQRQGRQLARVQNALAEAQREREKAQADAENAVQAALPTSDRLLVPEGPSLKMIEVTAILWVEADDNYLHVHTAGREYLLRRTLQDLLAQLGEQRFARIHKSTVVNLAEIQALDPLFKGDYEVRLRGGQRLRLSRRYREALFARLGR